MIQIPRRQVEDRLDLLPEKLKDIGFSPATVAALRVITEKEHLSYEKTGIVSELVGYVILGFLHAEDLGKEIRDVLGINQQIADSIAREIEKKIFAPIMNDLKKVYKPAALDSVAAGAGKISVDLPGPTPPISPEDIINLKSARPEVGADKKEISSEQAGAVSAEAELPSPGESPISLSELDESVKEKGAVNGSSAEGPLIIHKETRVRSASAANPARPSFGGLFNFLGRKEKKIEAPLRVEVELGGMPKPPSPPIPPKRDAPSPPFAPKLDASPLPGGIKIVHYTESDLKKKEDTLIKAESPKPVDVPAKPVVPLPVLKPAPETVIDLKTAQSIPSKAAPAPLIINQSKTSPVQPAPLKPSVVDSVVISRTLDAPPDPKIAGIFNRISEKRNESKDREPFTPIRQKAPVPEPKQKKEVIAPVNMPLPINPAVPKPPPGEEIDLNSL